MAELTKEYFDKEVENLAKIVSKGFEGVDKQFEEVKGDIGKIDERLQIVETKLDKALYREFQRIDKLETRMKVVEGKLGIAQKY